MRRDRAGALRGRGPPRSARRRRAAGAGSCATSPGAREPDLGESEDQCEPEERTTQVASRAGGKCRRSHFVDGDHRDWELLRDKIRDDVLERGWKDDVGAFTAAYDGTDIDASVLAVGLYGLVDSGDDRYLRTVDTVERELREGSTVFRYRGDDGLPGAEGGFHLMTAWLVDAYLATNREADARELFGGLAAAAGQTGLLSEEIHPITGRSLGNHPQAYSHLGLIHNALNLAAYASDGRPPADPEA